MLDSPNTSAPSSRSADHSQAEAARPERFLRRPEVLSRTGVSRSHLYWLMDRGQFPRSFPLSPRVTVWLESDVDAWIAAQIPANNKRASR
ncbi:AlpA family phage regulatory protein [Stenotrophomonas sp. B1-1]|uniref:helix-turn-helix transcriptional regulator n=1 Tax=Stenotrophomonas sp. B1-1 TaxID=2710648 RepID=UPI0013DB2D5B|nr:AlpA family phage regulatory protein [Stenotrophomonas sp. B1-1]